MYFLCNVGKNSKILIQKPSVFGQKELWGLLVLLLCEIWWLSRGIYQQLCWCDGAQRGDLKVGWKGSRGGEVFWWCIQSCVPCLEKDIIHLGQGQQKSTVLVWGSAFRELLKLYPKICSQCLFSGPLLHTKLYSLNFGSFWGLFGIGLRSVLHFRHSQCEVWLMHSVCCSSTSGGRFICSPSLKNKTRLVILAASESFLGICSWKSFRYNL